MSIPIGAENNVGAMNRAQQQYFEEHNTFGSSLKDINVDISKKTEDYRFLVQKNDQAVFHYALANNPQEHPSYIGAVYPLSPPKNTLPETEGSPAKTVTKICQLDVTAQTISLAKPQLKNSAVLCPPEPS
ncbi:type IV pilin-like G/H family protein [Spirulina sp. CS-785/01]|uniref:type IV pilin-like G/H family protein n=1 Tax=Spirulina sp. CS-785/01 TaxID=3021716 RepID=UPI00232D764D|nr:type IV pilin-like G/H family protein [Spirulina sp. CS-785/01]MDB9313101.1 type IV pilin-like G/H family protein [Spirulina sp. CS-785/01]